MNGMKARSGALQEERAANPAVAVRRRQQLRPFLFHMGPVALCISSVLLIALMAVLYLSQLGQAQAANQQLQKVQHEQDTLVRQNQDLGLKIAQEQSPASIAAAARAQGLVPADPKAIKILIEHHLQPIPDQDQTNQP